MLQWYSEMYSHIKPRRKRCVGIVHAGSLGDGEGSYHGIFEEKPGHLHKLETEHFSITLSHVISFVESWISVPPYSVSCTKK